MLLNNGTMLLDSKYARIERERRFLVGHFPHGQPIVRVRRITDRYIDGTDLRLREQKEEDRASVFKLTQKIFAPAEEPSRDSSRPCI